MAIIRVNQSANLMGLEQGSRQQAQKVSKDQPVKAGSNVHDHQNFKAMLHQQMACVESVVQENLKLSAHAQQRLEQRQIHLDSEDFGKLNRAVSEIEKKGGRNSVVFYKEIAFITNVPSRTIVTAIPIQDEMNVLTNIDSAVTIR
jgi:flagellar operon protein